MSTIKVNKIEKRTGSTLTLGGACTAVTLACGATQTGFGRTGTVDWCTTAKTSPFASVNGKGYFINTTSGSVTVTLPSSPSAGDIIAINDYARTFACNSVTICRNGSKMCGFCFNTSLANNGKSITLVYVDGTKGWKAVNDDNVSTLGSAFIEATGGTITTVGNSKVHTFTGDGNFVVSAVGNAAGSETVEYLVVAGGGGGGGGAGPSSVGSGGGGGGGYRESPGAAAGCYAVSPLGTSPAVALPVAAQSYPVTVGGGGTPGAYGPSAGTPGGDGCNSVFAGSSTITSTGGGGGGARLNSPANGRPGGSGGGTAYDPGTTAGGTGNTPPVNPPQGNDGGNRTGDGAGGGGGATAVGGAGSTPTNGPGGAGATSAINGTPTGRSGGGGAGATSGATTGGTASDGGGAGSPANPGGTATAGTTNTGGGGGGASSHQNNAGAAGGSGVVIIRYKFQ